MEGEFGVPDEGLGLSRSRGGELLGDFGGGSSLDVF